MSYQSTLSFLWVRKSDGRKIRIWIYLLGNRDERQKRELLENPFSQLLSYTMHRSVRNLSVKKRVKEINLHTLIRVSVGMKIPSFHIPHIVIYDIFSNDCKRGVAV